MTILNKENTERASNGKKASSHSSGNDLTSGNDLSQKDLNSVESQFSKMMEQFSASTGFSVNTAENAVDTMVEVLSSKGVMVSLTVLLAYIRYCINHGVKKDITLKIGYNKPPSIPMNFAINEEMLEEIYPGDVVEIN